ncbi:tol-pal system protein YbgF [Desulfobacula sp.]
MKIIYSFVCMVALSVFLSGCIEPRDFAALETKVAALEIENARQLSGQKAQVQQNQLELKKKIKVLENRLNKSASISQEEYAKLKYTITTLKEGHQRLKGLIEEMNHKFGAYTQMGGGTMAEKMERLDQAISRNYEKVINLEKYMGFEPSAAGETEKKGPSEGLEKSPEKQLYAEAKKLFDDGDRENARIRFENFITRYPDSDNADNARFWIADSYYVQKWFEKAILEYQKVLEEYPHSNKLAAARLKQGYAFAQLGEKANARLILKELIKKHPGTNEAGYAQKKLKTLK